MTNIDIGDYVSSNVQDIVSRVDGVGEVELFGSQYAMRATAMRQEGMVPIVKKQSWQGKTFWRVIVGPAQSKSEQSVLLKKVKDVGFDDAYAVTN